jgi:hypothetical protein
MFDGVETLTGGGSVDVTVIAFGGSISGSTPDGASDATVTMGDFVDLDNADLTFDIDTAVDLKLTGVVAPVLNATLVKIGFSGGSGFVGTGDGTPQALGFDVNVSGLVAGFVIENGGTGRVWRSVSAQVTGSLIVAGMANIAVASLQVEYNGAAADGSVVDWNDVDADQDGVFDDAVAMEGRTLTASTALEQATADGASIDLGGGFLTGTADLVVTKRAVSVKPDDNAAVAGTLLWIALSDLDVSVGSSAYGVDLGQGSIQVASVAAGAARWIGVVGNDITATISLGALASITVANVDLAINKASVGAAELDFGSEISLDGDQVFDESPRMSFWPDPRSSRPRPAR